MYLLLEHHSLVTIEFYKDPYLHVLEFLQYKFSYSSYDCVRIINVYAVLNSYLK